MSKVSGFHSSLYGCFCSYFDIRNNPVRANKQARVVRMVMEIEGMRQRVEIFIRYIIYVH